MELLYHSRPRNVVSTLSRISRASSVVLCPPTFRTRYVSGKVTRPCTRYVHPSSSSGCSLLQLRYKPRVGRGSDWQNKHRLVGDANWRPVLARPLLLWHASLSAALQVAAGAVP